MLAIARALEASDRAVVMRRGQIVLEGAGEDIAESSRVRDVYLRHTSEALAT